MPPITVTALFFAHYQDIVGARAQQIMLAGDPSVQTLAEEIERRYPRLEGLLTHGRAAVNAEFADGGTRLQEGDEIAWMPPMSGGTGDVPMHRVALVEAPIDENEVRRSVEGAGFGAVVTFLGTVRDHAAGRQVRYLEYEAYVPLARKQISALAEEAADRWQTRCAVTHRLGRLEIGECSVVVAVAAAHRAEAFEACRWLMDTLKTTAPIWKKEYFEGGACWIEGPHALPSSTAPSPVSERQPTAGSQ
jgi:molybdopterin synthase catalytic subunit